MTSRVAYLKHLENAESSYFSVYQWSGLQSFTNAPSIENLRGTKWRKSKSTDSRIYFMEDPPLLRKWI